VMTSFIIIIPCIAEIKGFKNDSQTDAHMDKHISNVTTPGQPQWLAEA